MQVKTIEKNIRAKMEEWLKTITDDKLRGDVKENLLVSGGSIASMLLNQPVNDYDVYLMDIDVVKRLAIYYTQSDRNIVIFDGREKEKLVKSLNDGYIDNGGDKRILGIDRNNAHAISLRNLKADQILRELAALAGGSGGGKSTLATGGLKDPAKIDKVLESLPVILEKYLKT